MSARDLPAPDVLKRLVIVLHTRLSGAERAMHQELVSVRKIEVEIGERQGKVGKLDNDLLDLQQYLSGECFESDGTASSADYQLGLEQRFWIDYDLQRERYYLDITYDEHRVQLEKVVEARKTFKAMKYKYDTLVEKLRSAKLSRDAIRTRKEDAERQDLVRSSVM